MPKTDTMDHKATLAAIALDIYAIAVSSLADRLTEKWVTACEAQGIAPTHRERQAARQAFLNRLLKGLK